MKQIATMNSVHTMTSREIAELTGKDHGSVVVRDIENLMKSLGIHPAKLQDDDFSGISCTRKAYNGRDVVDFYELDKEMTMTLVTGYSIPLRHAVIKRWQELERNAAKPVLPDFTNPVVAARAWADSEEGRLEAEKQLALAAPKVDFADRVSNGKGTMTRRNAAKCLQHPPMAFNQWLKDNRFSNRDGMPAQSEIKRGHQRVVVGENNGHTHSTPRITAKGLIYYAVKLYSSEVPDDVLGNIESFKESESE